MTISLLFMNNKNDKPGKLEFPCGAAGGKRNGAVAEPIQLSQTPAPAIHSSHTIISELIQISLFIFTLRKVFWFGSGLSGGT